MLSVLGRGKKAIVLWGCCRIAVLWALDGEEQEDF